MSAAIGWKPTAEGTKPAARAKLQQIMVFESLTQTEKKIIYDCLNAAVDYLSDSHSVLLVGKNHETIKKVMGLFPNLRDSDVGENGEIQRLIYHCLGHFSNRWLSDRTRARLFSVSLDEVGEMWDKWISLNGEPDDWIAPSN